MAVISEVNALFDLVGKAASFITYLHDGWYKGKAELKAFPSKVSMLQAKQAQWTSLLEKFGMSEDEHLKPLVKAAAQILDEEAEYVQRMQRSCFLRFKRRAFPGQLTSILDNVLAIVEAGPQLLATRIETSELLEKISARTPVLLPFRQDQKYVPLLGLVTKVEKALEDAQGPRVVTLYGGPGMGKSSLSKFIALRYQAMSKEQMGKKSCKTTHFPDGVFYMFCGKGAVDRVKQLQLELLEGRGFAIGLESQPADSMSTQEQKGEYLHLPSPATKLRSHLAEQKLLIILDDIWEQVVLEQLLVPAPGVKYLVTSQRRGIWDDAAKIELGKPSMKEARQIMAKYTEGLPTKYKFPDSIQSVTDDIIEKLEYHPLSLANVGLSINRSRATNPDEWKSVKESLRDLLDENDFHSRPVVYERMYPLTVDASMMLMVDCLLPAARRLFFLIGLLQGPELPEVLVKFFFKFVKSKESKYKLYKSYMNYLEDRSLVEIHHHGSRSVLAAHSLRTHYIRENNNADLTSMAIQILGDTNYDDARLIRSGNADELLVTVLGAMFYAEPFSDVVAAMFQKQIRIMNGDSEIPRSMGSGLDALDLVERAQGRKFEIGSLVWLLNPDGEVGWKQQAHECARKTIIRLICRNELDDNSVTGLLRLPQTTLTAFSALDVICTVGTWKSAFSPQNRTFTSTHGETMKTLMALMHNNDATSKIRARAIGILGEILEFESEDTILNVAKKWVEFLAKDSDLNLQEAVAVSLSSRRLVTRASILIGKFPHIVERLLKLMVLGKSGSVQVSATQAIDGLSRVRSSAVNIAGTPGALRILFCALGPTNLEAGPLLLSAASALHNLSSVPENRIKFGAIEDGLEGLSELLARTFPVWDIQLGREVKMVGWECESVIKILGNLALSKKLRETIVTLPDIHERLRDLQLGEDRDELDTVSEAAGRTLTLLDPFYTNPASSASALEPAPLRARYQVFKGRAGAHLELGMYSEALADLDMAHHHLRQIRPDEDTLFCFVRLELQQLRIKRIYLKAQLKDYTGAIIEADNLLEESSVLEGYVATSWEAYALGQRGVVHRLSGNLTEALTDLDKSVKLSHSHDRLMHRGFVKYLMGDEKGAKSDAQVAEQKDSRSRLGETTDDALSADLLLTKVNYLGFSF